MENLKSAITNNPSRGMIKDLNDSYVGKEVVTHARNAVVNSHLGDLYAYSPEPANLFCCNFPYTYNGNIALVNNQFLIFSTDNTNSEIGIFDEPTCTYTKVVNAACLNFNLSYPVTGRSKMTDVCSQVVTFTDNYNPVRRIDLSNIPYLQTGVADDTCQTPKFGTVLDCSQILLFMDISVPGVSVQNVAAGAMTNGSYEFLMAYFVNGEKYSDYYSLTLPAFVFDQGGVGGGLSVTFSGLDDNFLQYAVVMVATVGGISTASQIGIYNISQTVISVARTTDASYINIPLSSLVISKINYEKAGIISGNSRYLMIADLTQKRQLNYQQAANQITAQYVVTQYPVDYYAQFGENIGYYRGEVYAFYLRWLYVDGSFGGAAPTDWNIAGRKATASDLSPVTGDDIYEYDLTTGLQAPSAVYQFEAYNTAQQMVVENNPFVGNTRELGYGYMGYWQSTVDYPNNIAMFGGDACTPIRHHKMPGEAIVPRYSTVNGQVYINVLGVRFSNIAYPLDDTGAPAQGIVGYEILRGDRAGGNRSIIARGMLTNVRSYIDTTQGLDTTVLYSNYPYNSRVTDPYLSSTAVTSTGGNENNYTGLSTVLNDQFTFYTPHAYFNNKYRMGREFDIESEEIGTVNGYFEQVYQHPKAKLLTSFSLYFSILAGVIEGYLATTGKKTITYQYSNADVSGLDSGGYEQGTAFEGETALTGGYISTLPADSVLTSLFPTKIIQQTDQAFTTLNIPNAMSPGAIAERAIIIALQALALVGAFIYSSAQFMTAAINIIYGFSSYQEYAYQYDSHGSFRSQAVTPIAKGFQRRYALQQPQYIASALQNIGDSVFNNFGKQQSVYVQFNKPLSIPTTIDTTLRTISSFGTANDPTTNVTSLASAFYATSKQPNPGQYGQIDSVQKVKTANNINLISGEGPYTSPVVYGGDCIIAPFTILTKQPIFSQNIANQHLPDGTPFNYSLYRNIGYPRFWEDTTQWQVSDLISKTPDVGSLPNRKYNLDCTGNAGSDTDWVVENRYFYLYINGVLDFIVEADYDIAFRQEVPGQLFYDTNTSDLTEIFRSDRVGLPEPFVLDQSFYKIQSNEFYSQQQLLNYDPTIDETCTVHNRNSLIYSLPSFISTLYDNWQYFMPGNFYTFDQNDFGNLTTIKQLDQTRVIFLFDKTSPYVSYGQDEMQTTDGLKVRIGDGGLFARPPRELEHTDVSYGNSKSRFAFVSTQYGDFYPSYSQGRLFNFTGELQEVQQGLHYWCHRYMQIQLYKAFPNYPQTYENPLARVGYFTFFDNTNKTVYITKKDYIPQTGLTNLTYDPSSDQFLNDDIPVQLTDPTYFNDISWTLSYSPEEKAFLSFHDWHPTGIIQTENHFISIQGNTAWKHNERCDLYSNFYGVDYPFEIEYAATTGQQVHIVDNIEYGVEAYTYKNQCQDKFNVTYGNFDNLIVYNAKQISGMLTMVPESENPMVNIGYPIFNGAGYNILFKKYEQKYRVNQFEDITLDQGEITGNQYALFFSDPSGYKRVINPGAINYEKPATQRKNFRHYTNFFWFGKAVVGNLKLICKFFNARLTVSPR